MRSIALFLFALLLFSLFLSSNMSAETWKITSLNWQPYSGAKLGNQGNSVQILRSLLEKKGIKLLVEFYPWKRAQHKAGSEGYVGYFPAWPEEVAEGFVASPPIDKSELGVLTRTDQDISYESMNSLFKKYRVGIVWTYVYPDKIVTAVQKHPRHVDKSSNETALMKKLSVGRIDVALTDPNVMLFLAGKKDIDNIKALDETIREKPLLLAFRDDPQNLKKLELLKKLLKSK